MKRVYVGCCGFPCSRRKYFELFSVVELQNTFYDLPTEEWATRVRGEAPRGFKFVIKAWQAITHPPSSPTWRKMRKRPSGNLENYGLLKPTRENIEAFERTVKLAESLEANIVVLQTPPTMPHDEIAIRRIDAFFEEVRPLLNENIVIAWEVRGPLARSPHLEDVFERHDLLHVVDIFRGRPVHKHRRGLFYTRLHGIGPGEVNYKYDYTDADLSELGRMIFEEDFSEGYVMFNNVKMLDNALKLKSALKSSRGLHVL